MPNKPKRRARKVRGDKAQKALVQKKKQLVKKATLRDEDVTVIEIRIRPPHSALLGRRVMHDPMWPPAPKDLDVSDYDGDLRDPIEIRNTDMKDLPRIMDMDSGDRIPV